MYRLRWRRRPFILRSPCQSIRGQGRQIICLDWLIVILVLPELAISSGSNAPSILLVAWSYWVCRGVEGARGGPSLLCGRPSLEASRKRETSSVRLCWE